MLIPLLDIDKLHEYLFDYGYGNCHPKLTHALVHSLDTFHSMFIGLFEQLQYEKNFIEILFVCPLTRNLMMADCHSLCKDSSNDAIIRYIHEQNYIDALWPEHEIANNPVFIICARLEDTILNKLVTLQNHLKTTNIDDLTNYILDFFHITKPLTYQNVKEEYEKACNSNQFTIKMGQYYDFFDHKDKKKIVDKNEKLSFVPQLDKDKELRKNITDYFDELFDKNRKVFDSTKKPNGVDYILGDYDNDENIDDDEDDDYIIDNNDEDKKDMDNDDMDVVDMDMDDNIDNEIANDIKVLKLGKN